MDKPCSRYTAEDISKFVDNELPSHLYPAMVKHLGHCLDCRSLVERYRCVSNVFNDSADQSLSGLDTAGLKQKISRTLPPSKEKSQGNVSGFFRKNIYLKLASIAAIVMLGLLPFQGALFEPTGPSAIVKSVDTDFSSVMIIETQKEKHTIIWFSET